jgi:cyclohexanone monooxygenase
MAAQEGSTREERGIAPQVDYDAVVVGAGFSGLYMLQRLRQLGFSTRVYEAGADVGGTWYWNRYPGARCDSESVYYMFSDHLSEEILQEWTWSERFARQPEILRYLQFVADRLDLRSDIQFNTRITAAHFDETHNLWRITTSDGVTVQARFFIAAVGCLSTANIPQFKGLESFKGAWYHTGQWPHDKVDFTGKKVAVIGTGATAVQVVPEVAREAEHVFVFQRTPNFDIPGRNHLLDEDYVRKLKANYSELWGKARATGFGFPYESAERTTFSVPDEERLRIYEAAWQEGGFHVGLDTFSDVLLDEAANESIAEFVRGKIREMVHKPEVAELLAPRDHHFFTKRPPLEHGYYEAFNRDNVTLVDVKKTPIEEITPTGVRTADGRSHDVDIIIFATGFDAMTGTLFAMDIRGRNGMALREQWADGPRTYIGLAVHNFPNMFLITGPQSPSVLSNMPVAIEQHVEWIADCLKYLRDHDETVIEATREAEDGWVALATEIANMTLIPRTPSWWVGGNIPGKPRLVYPFVGGLQVYRQACEDVAANNYKGFVLQGHEHGRAAAAS